MLFTTGLKSSLYLLLIGLSFHLSAFGAPVSIQTNAVDGKWVIDPTIAPYCDIHPEPYSKDELNTLRALMGRLPAHFTLIISGLSGRDDWSESHKKIGRRLQLQQIGLEHYHVFLGGVPTQAQNRLYELRPSPLGEGYLELLNVDTEACGLNNTVITLKLIALNY